MVQNMDHIEASCIFYDEVGTLNGLEQSTICVSTVTTLVIAMLAIHHDMMFSVCWMYDSRDSLRQSSADVCSVEECRVFITQRRDLGRCSR